GGGGSSSVPNPVTSPPPAGATVDNLSFTNTDFTEVAISNSFAVIVQYGDRFDIEMEVDTQYSHLVTVTQEGVRMKIQYDPNFKGDIRAQVAKGIVTLPSLQVLEVDGSAIVDVAGFTQSFLQIRQNGSSHVEGNNSRFDFVDASLNGSAHLSLLGFSPVPAINIEAHGSGQAMLSLMDGGTLTGTASGNANVSFYGRNLIVQSNALQSATFTWMGPVVP
ncbi:MAG: GIN domain-containing protein, partial [Woeseiaceae bacterium]